MILEEADSFQQPDVMQFNNMMNKRMPLQDITETVPAYGYNEPNFFNNNKAFTTQGQQPESVNQNSQQTMKTGFSNVLLLTPKKNKGYFYPNSSSKKIETQLPQMNPYVSPQKLPSISPILRKIQEDEQKMQFSQQNNNRQSHYGFNQMQQQVQHQVD